MEGTTRGRDEERKERDSVYTSNLVRQFLDGSVPTIVSSSVVTSSSDAFESRQTVDARLLSFARSGVRSKRVKERIGTYAEEKKANGAKHEIERKVRFRRSSLFTRVA